MFSFEWVLILVSQSGFLVDSFVPPVSDPIGSLPPSEMTPGADESDTFQRNKTAEDELTAVSCTQGG